MLRRWLISFSDLHIGLNDLFKDLQRHHLPVVGVTVLEGVQEFLDRFVVEGVDGYDLVVRKDDHDRDRDVQRIAFVERVVLRRCFDDDQLNIVVFLKTAFHRYPVSRSKVDRYVQRIRQFGEFLLLQRWQYVYPGAIVGFVDGYRLMVDIFEVLDHLAGAKVGVKLFPIDKMKCLIY